MPAKATKKVIGYCKCVLCGADKCEVREDEQGRAYLVMDCCVAMLRSSSRGGAAKIRAMITAPSGEGASEAGGAKLDAPTATGSEAAPPAKEKSRGGFADLLGLSR